MYRIATALSEPEANKRGSYLIGRTLRNARDCGQRCKELWLCANGGMIIRACSAFHFKLHIVSLSRNKKNNSNSLNEKGQELGMLWGKNLLTTSPILRSAVHRF